MSSLLRLSLVLACLVSVPAWAGAAKEFRMTANDVFAVSETDDMRVEVQKEEAQRFADVLLTSKRGYPFSMMLYFKRDTPDIAQFDSAEKIARSVRTSSEKYLSGSVEKKIELQSVAAKDSYGSLTVLTDAKLAGKATPPEGEFRYLTRGMVRLSKDSALGFSLMTNDVKSADYQKLLGYVYAFVKTGGKAAAPAAPAAVPAKAMPAAAPAAPAAAEPAAAAAPPARAKAGSRSGQDARECLKLEANAKVRACAEKFR